MTMRIVAHLENIMDMVRVDIRQEGNYIVLDPEVGGCIMLYINKDDGLTLEFDTVDGQQQKYVVGDLADLDFEQEK